MAFVQVPEHTLPVSILKLKSTSLPSVRHSAIVFSAPAVLLKQRIVVVDALFYSSWGALSVPMAFKATLFNRCLVHLLPPIYRMLRILRFYGTLRKTQRIYMLSSYVLFLQVLRSL